MKKLLLLLILFLGLQVVVVAQSNNRAPVLTESTVVRDADGTVYPSSVWRRLLSTGSYTIKAYRKSAADTVTYVLSRRSDEEKEAMIARLPKPAESTVFKTGELLKHFKDKDINGEKFDTKKLAGKVIVLNFWFINCPPCRQEIPDLNKLVDDYKDNKDVVFIAVALDEAYQIEEFIKQQPFNYHIIENGRFLANRFGLHLYPTNVIVDKDGKIVFSSVSFNFANPRWMKKAIDDALAAEKTKQAASE
ncbi:TlpA disulfide reductase family protein [Mucilaginibacter sp. PAMB04274]|uniref:TlpA family protein disulfide reductase n=1 Tax=Mucilaginibacter sp. PAMB04274 TaxID=3138568 RepID=UPI0031F63F5D